jgi:hypothetical protein
MDRLSLQMIQLYFVEEGLTVAEYLKYMHKHYKHLNMREPVNQLGFIRTMDSKKIKRELKHSDKDFSTLFRSLQRFKSGTIRRRRPVTKVL